MSEEFGVAALGTIQLNRKGIPQSIKDTGGRDVGDYQVGKS